MPSKSALQKAARERAERIREVREALKPMPGLDRFLGAIEGHGTAWGWLHVYVGENPYLHLCVRHGGRHFGDSACSPEDCLACKWYETVPRQALQTTIEVTGRKGEYDGRINVLTQ